jgi:hypothetical protein
MSDIPSASARSSAVETLRRLALALGCAAVVLFFFSPSWGAFVLWARVPEMGGMLEVRRGVSVLAQMAHPGAPVADPLHAAIQWRLLFPVIGHLLSLPPAVLFALADVGAVAALFYLIVLLRRGGLGWLDCGLATVALGACSWFFTSTGWLGYYDSWFALALLIVAFAKSDWSLWAACVWAPWIDERFVLAAPLALFCRWLWLTDSADTATPRFEWKRTLLPSAGLLALFVVVRLGLLSGETASGATASGYLAQRHYLDAPLGRILLGVWDGLRAGWIFGGVAVFLIGWGGGGARRPRAALAFAAAVVALAAIGLATAQDYDRSMTMLWPAAVLGVLLAVRRSWAPLRLTLRGAAVVALLLPAHHVMNDRVNPIYYLYHELAALTTPPPGAMPEVYELHAIHEMERGDYAAADRDLTLAIKLSRNPASPARQRGILAASQGHWDSALEDFALALEHDPQNPDAWLMRAQAHFALGHAAQARSDLDRALALAPDGWAKRPDVARFLAKLNRAP